jgi:hypothetical protein
VPTPPVTVFAANGKDSIIMGYKNDPEDLPVVQAIFQSFYDAPYGFKEEISEISLALGGEYGYRNTFFIRTGYFYSSKRKENRRYLTFGAGMIWNYINFDLAYYFAFTNTDPMANTVKLSISFCFGN